MRWLGRPMMVMVGVAALALPAAAHAIPAPNDPSYPTQTAPGGALAIIHEPQALATIGSTPLADVLVSTLDSGMELTNPDLGPRLFSFSADEAVPAPSAGTAHAGAHGWNYINAAPFTGQPSDYGYDFNAAAGSDDPSALAGNGDLGHGTAVTGLIAAAWNNGIGGVGVAPNARVFALRTCWVSDECPQNLQGPAIALGAAHHVRVVSMSWNAEPGDFNKAVVQAHPEILFAALAGGNGGPDELPTDTYPCALSVAPTNAGVDNVICVSTSKPDDSTDCGAVSGAIVDLAVPTENNVTTTVGGGSGATGCATSYASPTIAGAATVLLGLDPTASGADVKRALVDSARVVPAWAGHSKSGGILDLDAAVKLFAQRRGITLKPDTGTTGTTGTTGNGGNDVTPTTLRIAFSPRTFTAVAVNAKKAWASAKSAATKRKVSPTPKGSKLVVNLSEAAKVTVTLRRAVAGHRSGKHCLVGRKRGAKSCTTSVAAGSISAGSRPKGRSTISVRGRTSKGRAWTAGRYTASATAKDAAGNKSKAARAGFVFKAK
jgi:hypothetical protein